MSAQARAHIAPNGLRLVTAHALQSSGDQTVNASTVLPWLFAALGVPSALTGVLVPILGPQYRLNPMIAAAAMAFSSVFVVTNSLRLRKAKL